MGDVPKWVSGIETLPLDGYHNEISDSNNHSIILYRDVNVVHYYSEISVNPSYFTEFPHFVGQNDEKIQKPKKLAYTRYDTPNRFPDHESTISNPHHSEV